MTHSPRERITESRPRQSAANCLTPTTATAEQERDAEHRQYIARAQRAGIAAATVIHPAVAGVTTITVTASGVWHERRERRVRDPGDREVIDRPAARAGRVIAADPEPNEKRLTGEVRAEIECDRVGRRIRRVLPGEGLATTDWIVRGR